MLLCRSHASLSVCIPTDPKTAISPKRNNDTSYSRLNDATRSVRRSDRDRAVTLQMVTKTESLPKKQKTTFSDFSVVPTTGNDEHTVQVVVLKVQLHCRGCVGKVKRHLSKMEGVSSFSIDLESKRVTVTGLVSPAGVLESISKVKKAELLAS